MTFYYEETLCPFCNGLMISKKSSYGIFWGCKNFPNCKGTRDSLGRSKENIAKEKGEDTMYEDKDGMINIVEDEPKVIFNKRK